jgi:ATPase involved in DNA replication initiation
MHPSSPSFDTFPVTDTNRLAYSAAMAVAEAPGRFNPLWLHGGTPEQRAHLLGAIAQYAKTLHPKRGVTHLTAANPGDGLVFSGPFAAADVLLVDDVQTLSEPSWQPLRRVLQAWSGRRRQVVIAADGPPDPAAMGRVLVSAVQQGLVVDLDTADVETKVAILTKIANQERLRVAPPVLDLIAARTPNSVRMLEGALWRVVSWPDRAPIDVALAAQVLAAGPTTAAVSVEEIVEKTAKHYGVTTDALRGRLRGRVLITARQVAMYLCHELTDQTVLATAATFDRDDHTAVTNAIRKIRELMGSRTPVLGIVYTLLQELAAAQDSDSAGPESRPESTDGAGPLERADAHERRAYDAIVGRRYAEARSQLAEAVTADPGRAERMTSEIGGLLDLWPPTDALRGSEKTRATARVDWLCGLWAATAKSSPYRWPEIERESFPAPTTRPVVAEPPARKALATPDVSEESPGSDGRPEAVGRRLEDAVVEVIRALFDVPLDTGRARLRRLRRQRAGSQQGHDIAFEVTEPGWATVRCHVECKNIQGPVTLDDIGGKILATADRWPDTKIDHFIVVSPRSRPANDLAAMVEGWNAHQRFPFEVSIWSPDVGIEELFRLAPNAYERVYGKRAEPLDAAERVAVAARWRDRLRPVVRLDPAVVRYLRTPGIHDLSGESADRLARTQAEAIPLDVVHESGTPMPGTLEDTVREWLADPTQQTLLLLGEFGDGKTFFCYQLATRLAQEYLRNPAEGWIPLSLPLREFRRERSMAGLLHRRLATVGIDPVHWATLCRDAPRTLVILDGFDEMSTRMDPEAVTANLRALQDGLELFPTSKILITSRTHFFEHSDDRQRFVEHAGNPRVLRIAPIPRQRAMENLRSHAERLGMATRVTRLKRLHDPIGLASKPLFLQMIKDALPTLDVDHFDEVTLYEHHIHSSLKRKWHDLRDESSRVLDDALKANLLAILEEIAVILHTSAASYVDLRRLTIGGSDNLAEILWRMSDGSSPTDPSAAPDARARVGIRSLLRPVPGADPQAWPVDFFHRSVREYFVARAIVRALATDCDPGQHLLGQVPLQPEITNFAVQLMRSDRTLVQTYADRLKHLARSAALPQAAGSPLGGNALTLLYRLVGRIEDHDWSGLALDGAQLADADLSGRTFRGSSLRGANLDNTRLEWADFRDADLTGVQLEQTARAVALAIDGDSVVVAYADNTLRRWSVEAGSVTSREIASFAFPIRTVLRSPFGDLVVGGDHHAAVLCPDGPEGWRLAALFETRPDLADLSTSNTALAVRRVLPDGSAVLHRFDPVSRSCDRTIATPGEGRYRLLDDRRAYTHTTGGLAFHADTAIRSVAVAGLTCADTAMLAEDTALLLLGHANGELSAHTLTFARSRPRLSERWRVAAHDATVTDVRIGAGFVVSASADRSVRLFPLLDERTVGAPLRLHRTLHCHGMQIDGVRGPREHDLLAALIRDDAGRATTEPRASSARTTGRR